MLSMMPFSAFFAYLIQPPCHYFSFAFAASISSDYLPSRYYFVSLIIFVTPPFLCADVADCHAMLLLPFSPRAFFATLIRAIYYCFGAMIIIAMMPCHYDALLAFDAATADEVSAIFALRDATLLLRHTLFCFERAATYSLFLLMLHSPPRHCFFNIATLRH